MALYGSGYNEGSGHNARSAYSRRCHHEPDRVEPYSRQRTSYSRTASSKPLSVTSPRSAYMKFLPESRCRTASGTRISPAPAWSLMRAEE